MKLKSKPILSLILGFSMCATLGVSAIDYESESSSDTGSCLTTPSCSSDSDSDGGSEAASVGACSVSDSSSLSDQIGALAIYPVVSSEVGKLRAPLDDKTVPRAGRAYNFPELVERLRARQQLNGWKHAIHIYDCESHEEDFSEYVYWINTKLPTDNVNLYNKWFGENLQDHGASLPNGVVALLPTSYALRGHSYTVADLEDIILDESNWEAHKGTQTTTTGVCTESGANCPTLDSYIGYLRAQGITIRG